MNLRTVLALLVFLLTGCVYYLDAEKPPRDTWKADAKARAEAKTLEQGPTPAPPPVPLPAPGPLPPPEEDVSSTVLDKWALVVGIGKFQDRRIKPLSYTAKDARDMYDFLIDPKAGRFKPDHVWKLIDEEATAANLRHAIGQLSLKAKRDDLVVIYLSSHGSPKSLDLTANEEDKQVNYIVPHDTRLDDGASLYATAFPMREFEDVVENRLRARRVVIFMDTCYSAGVFQGVQVASLVGGKSPDKGLIEEGLGISHRMVNKLAQGTGRVIITSSNSNERSWESDEIKNGYFTYYLLQGLRQEGGMVSIEKVYNYLRDNVPQRVKKDKGQLQNPVLGKSVRGKEIVIGVPVD